MSRGGSKRSRSGAAGEKQGKARGRSKDQAGAQLRDLCQPEPAAAPAQPGESAPILDAGPTPVAPRKAGVRGARARSGSRQGTPKRREAPAPSPPSRSVRTTPAEPGRLEAQKEELLAAFRALPRLESWTAPPLPLEPLPAGSPRRLAFVLHMHLPWVLGHGTWPHGEVWLAEAVVHCYLPVLDAVDRLARRGRRSLATVSVTPVVAAMLADTRSTDAVERYFSERKRAAWESRKTHPLALWWRQEFERLEGIWNRVDRNLGGWLTELSDQGAIELSTSAGAHLYLPLAHTQKLIRLALRTGRELHREIFGVDPRGCWMPECAYRPGGPWKHPVTGLAEEDRPGNEEFLEEQGLGWTVVDSHLIRSGDPAFPYGSDLVPEEVFDPAGPHPRPYWIRKSAVAAFLRDPRLAAQVWSRQGGYPGEGDFLDFHKRHWPSGLRLWRVTGSEVGLGDKLVYWPELARSRAREQASHFIELVAGYQGVDGGVLCAPFDFELFGHWWFEGPIWLERVLELAEPGSAVESSTPARELDARPALRRAFFDEGSWGAGGDHRVWVNPQTEWFWHELADLERRAFQAVRWGGSRLWRRAILNQLLLAAASDWPFLVTMGTGSDYAAERFRLHASRLRELVELGPRARNLPAWVPGDLPFREIEPEWAWPSIG